MYFCKNCDTKKHELPSYTEHYFDDYYQDLLDQHCTCGDIYIKATYCTECNTICPAQDTINGLCSHCQKVTLEELEKILPTYFAQNQIEYLYEYWQV